MCPFDNEGKNGKESRELRRIARARLTAALAREATMLATLVNAVVSRIDEKVVREMSADALWSRLLGSSNLTQTKNEIDNQTGAYPELLGQVLAARQRVEREQLGRLRRAKAPQEHARRFGNTRLSGGVYATI
jgi:hypothetical protein